MEKSCVGRHEIARLKPYNISRDKLGGIHHSFLTVTDNPCVRCRHTFKSIKCLFRLALLHNTHYGVEDNYDKYESRLEKLHRVSRLCYEHFIRYCHSRDNCGNKQNDYHSILELVDKTPKARFLFLFAELVIAVLLPSLGYLLRRKTFLYVGRQLS